MKAQIAENETTSEDTCCLSLSVCLVASLCLQSPGYFSAKIVNEERCLTLLPFRAQGLSFMFTFAVRISSDYVYKNSVK